MVDMWGETVDRGNSVFVYLMDMYGHREMV